LLANRTFYECFGITGATLEGRNIQEIIPRAELTNAIKKVLTDSKADSFDMRYKISDYEKVFVVKVVPLRRDEVLVILTDVTEDRVRQEKLYLTDRLASIGEMAAGVAHELNNPLTSIVGLSQILVMNEDLSSQYKEDVKDIHQEAQRAAAIVRNLLTFSRKHSPTKESTQINAVLLDVLKLRGYEHKVSNIEVRTELDDELPEVMADYYQMQQLFLNIILNAESAMLESHNRGKLTITSGKTDTDIRIMVTDDGPGIPPENLTRVFDPFFTTKPAGKGTGLGLSICYGIVSEHKGKISAQSKLGDGATFIVELPINEYPEKEDGDEREPQQKMAHSFDRR
jgi:two-component system NtrC family sensor kinase